MKTQQLWPTPKVLIIDNDRTLLTMLANSLGQLGQNVVAIADNSTDAVKLFKKLHPEVVVLDINLGGVPNGVDLASLMEKTNPDIQFIFLTSVDDERLAFTSKNKTPKNYFYLRKQEIKSAKILSDAISESLGTNRKSEQPSPEEYSYDLDLSDRNIELMRHIANGYSNIKIARIFEIEIKSCENAISRLMKRLKIPADSDTNQRVLVARKYFEHSGIVLN